MIRIWAVDDSLNDLNHLNEVISAFFEKLGTDYQIELFSSADDLPEAPAIADLIILDIEIGTRNGLEISRELKKRNHHMQTVLLSNYPSYSIDGYSSGASRFLVKPLTEEQLIPAFDADFLKVLEQEISISDARIADVPVALGKILYIESIGRKTQAVLEDGRKLESRITLRDYAQLLRSRSDLFVQCYKSIYVNVSRIARLDPEMKDIVFENGMRVPYSRHFRKEVEEARRRWLCSTL